MNGKIKPAASGVVDEEARDALFRILEHQMETVLWTTDADLRITSFVGGGLAGVPFFQHDQVGESVGDLFRVDDPESIPMEAHRRALNGETVAFDIERDDRYYDAYVEPLRDREGRVVGCIGVAMSAAGSGSPLTAECASDRAESRTLSRRPTWGVAYDFNVLVVLIQGYSRLLLQRLAPDDPLCGVLRDIERSSDRAAAVLRGEHGDAEGRGVPGVGSLRAARGNGTFSGAQGPVKGDA